MKRNQIDYGYKEIFLVGDPHQAIYGFQVATPPIDFLFQLDHNEKLNMFDEGSFPSLFICNLYTNIHLWR